MYLKILLFKKNIVLNEKQSLHTRINYPSLSQYKIITTLLLQGLSRVRASKIVFLVTTISVVTELDGQLEIDGHLYNIYKF